MRVPGLSGWFGPGITGAERKQLREILLEGSSRDSLTTALAEAETTRIFDEIVGEDGYSSQLRDLIHAADKGGWLPDLIDAFAGQTERKDLVERAKAIVAAVEARRGAGGGGGGGAPSPGANKAMLLAGGVAIAVAGAVVVSQMRPEKEEPIVSSPKDEAPDATLVVKLMNGLGAVSGRTVFVEKVKTKQDVSDQRQSAITDSLGRATFRIDTSRGSLVRVGLEVPGKSECWWGDFGFGGTNFDPNDGVKTYNPDEITCGVVINVSSANDVAQALGSNNKSGDSQGWFESGTIAPRASFAPLGLPSTGFPVRRKLFTYGFDGRVGSAQWVAFNVDAQQSRGQRQDSVYSQDPAIPASKQHDANSYNDGRSDEDRYDRGHLVSLADIRIGKTDAENAIYQREAEYFPVIVPQSPGTNRTTWLAVEQFTRQQSNSFGPIHVIAGPIYNGSDDGTILTIGPKGVPIPAFLYRVLLRRDAKGGWRAIGFVVPNDGSIERNPKVFATSVSRIEQLTGISFFPNLDPALAPAVKGNLSAAYFEGTAAQPKLK